MPTYEEAQIEYCRAMGEELGMAYHLLWNQCALLHMRWDEYVALFGKSPAEFDIMNSVAPGFFKSVQDNAWEHILLHLCRFADPAKVSGRRTLSLDGLRYIPASNAVPNLQQLMENARGRIRFAQDWRNRRIAHADLEHALDNSAKPLVPASRTHVKEALAGIHAVLEAIDFHYTGSSLHFGGTGNGWGGTHLLRELKLVARLKSERQARIDSGLASKDDFDYAKWRGLT